MSTAATENMRSQRARLNASIQAAREKIRQPLLEKGDSILEAQRAIEQVLHDGLREGMERATLLDTPATVRSQAEREVTSFGSTVAIFEGDAVALPMLVSQLREAEGFLARIRGLEARLSAPNPPFDEFRLSPPPARLTAEGYISTLHTLS